MEDREGEGEDGGMDGFMSVCVNPEDYWLPNFVCVCACI